LRKITAGEHSCLHLQYCSSVSLNVCKEYLNEVTFTIRLAADEELHNLTHGTPFDIHNWKKVLLLHPPYCYSLLCRRKSVCL